MQRKEERRKITPSKKTTRDPLRREHFNPPKKKELREKKHIRIRQNSVNPIIVIQYIMKRKGRYS
jgi:hypothetical protein